MKNFTSHCIAVTFIALVLGGCKGWPIVPATGVTQTTAVLWAKGECASTDCEYYFKYWPADSSAAWGDSTQIRPTNGGVAADKQYDFAEPIADLQPDTAYHFTVCGREVGIGASFACSITESFRTEAPSEITNFDANLVSPTESSPNLVKLTWETNGITPGEKLHIYGAFSDPNYYRNVGYRSDLNNTTGIEFRVPPGTHRYILELPTPTGKRFRTTEVTVPTPVTPDIDLDTSPMHPLSISALTATWAPLKSWEYMKIQVNEPENQYIFTVSPTQGTGDSYTFDQQYLTDTLGHGSHRVKFSLCVEMQVSVTPTLTPDFCSDPALKEINIGSAHFTGERRRFVLPGESIDLAWSDTGDTTVISADTELGGERIVSTLSEPFSTTVEGAYVIQIESCINQGDDCADTYSVKSEWEGDVESVNTGPYSNGLYPAVGEVVAEIELGGGIMKEVLAPVTGIIVEFNVVPMDSVVEGQELLRIQYAPHPRTQLVVSSDQFEERSWKADYYENLFKRFDLPTLTHVGLGLVNPILTTEDKTRWVAGEFAEGSITHIAAGPGGYTISPLAVPLLQKPDEPNEPKRLVPVHPFHAGGFPDQKVTKQETIIEAGQYIWFINGGSRGTKEGATDWNRIIRFDRQGTNDATTYEDDRFCVFHVPDEEAFVLGIAWDELNNRLWYTEARTPREGTSRLAWFYPDDVGMKCENMLDYGPTSVVSTTDYCPTPGQSGTDCINYVELKDWEDGAQFIKEAAFLAVDSVDSNVIWIAGYTNSTIGRYDLSENEVDVLKVSHPTTSTNGLYGSGPWRLLTTEDYVYFSENFDGDVVRLSKQAYANAVPDAENINECKNHLNAAVNPCMEEIKVSVVLKDIEIFGDRLYFSGEGKLGYINLDTWTPGVMYTGLELERHPDRKHNGKFINGDFSISSGGGVSFTDYYARSVFQLVWKGN